MKKKTDQIKNEAVEKLTQIFDWIGSDLVIDVTKEITTDSHYHLHISVNTTVLYPEDLQQLLELDGFLYVSCYDLRQEITILFNLKDIKEDNNMNHKEKLGELEKEAATLHNNKLSLIESYTKAIEDNDIVKQLDIEKQWERLSLSIKSTNKRIVLLKEQSDQFDE